MPLADKLVHRIAIVTPTVIADYDDYNQPVAGPPRVEVVDGYLYPLNANERAQVNQGGAIVASHNVILPLRDVPESGWVRFDPDDGQRYDITGTDEHRYGRDPLIVVHLNRVEVETPVAAGS